MESQPNTDDVGEEENDGISQGLGRGRGGRPEKRVHECVAVKILQIFNRFSDSNEPHGQLEFLGNCDDDPSASGAVELRQD